MGLREVKTKLNKLDKEDLGTSTVNSGIGPASGRPR